MMSSTRSSESAPRSSTKDALGVTSPSSTLSWSTMICLTFSSTPGMRTPPVMRKRAHHKLLSLYGAASFCHLLGCSVCYSNDSEEFPTEPMHFHGNRDSSP